MARDQGQEEDYTYRRASGWAFLDPRTGRRAYSATTRKSQWCQNKKSRDHATPSGRREHGWAQNSKETGPGETVEKTTERRGRYPRHILRALSGILVCGGYTYFLVLPSRRVVDADVLAEPRA